MLASLAGKSMLKRLEHAPAGPSRYHKNGLIRTGSMACSSTSFSEAHRTPPKWSVLDLDATDDSLRQEVIYWVGERGPNPAPTGQSDGSPQERPQRNFSDPDSRVLKTRDGFVQGYNCQLAVDAAHQIITAQRPTAHGSDQDGLVPLLDATTATLGRKPREVSADASFCRQSNLAALTARRIRGYLAPGRAAHGSADPRGSPPAHVWMASGWQGFWRFGIDGHLRSCVRPAGAVDDRRPRWVPWLEA